MEDFCASAVLIVQQDTPEIEPSCGWKKGLVIFEFWGFMVIHKEIVLTFSPV